MSTTNPPDSTGPGMSNPPAGTHIQSRPKEIKLVSHSPIFYWWPIWFLGYIMALITLVENHRLAILPHETKVEEVRIADKVTGYRLEAPGTTTNLEKAYKNQQEAQGQEAFKARVSQRAW